MSKELTENEVFLDGVMVGISLHQKRVIAAHERKEPIDTLYYLQSGRERLEEFLNKICR